MRFIFILLAIFIFAPFKLDAQTDLKAPRGPLTGIWDIIDEGNDKYHALSLAISHQYASNARRTAKEPIYGVGVIRWPGKPYWSEASGMPQLQADGSVKMAFGQFGYCSCRKVKYTVHPSGDPDVLEGEWVYEGKGDLRPSGKSTWRRRPPVEIDTIVHNKSEALAIHGTGPLRIDQSYTSSDFRINIIGKRLAGGHNFLIDAESDVLKTREISWICKKGGHQAYGDSWRGCGSKETLGDGVVGISLVIRPKKKPLPAGFYNAWLDGQKIPIEVYQASEEITSEKNNAEIRLVDHAGNPVPEDQITYGDHFFLKVVYDRAPKIKPKSLALSWGNSQASLALYPVSGKKGRVFSSKILTYHFDQKAILKQEGAE